MFYPSRNQSVLIVLNISRVGRSIVRLRRLQISEKGRLCIGFALGAAFATRQYFSRLSQIDRLIVRLIIFKICRSSFSNAPFLNLGQTWSDRFSQRVAGPPALARSFRRMLLRASPSSQPPSPSLPNLIFTSSGTLAPRYRVSDVRYRGHTTRYRRSHTIDIEGHERECRYRSVVSSISI
jgi:hypothetical protein